MKRIKSKDELLQYVFDYGLDKTSQLLSISQEDILEKLYDLIGVYYPKKFYYKEQPINEKVLKYCYDNYQNLYNKFVRNKDIIKCSLTLEDVLHESIINMSTKQIYEDINNVEDFVISQIYTYIKYWEFHQLINNKYITYAHFIKEKEDAEKYDF